MQKVVLDLGGSIVMPKEFDSEFLAKLKQVLIDLSKDKKVFIVIGGGWPCREYISRVKEVSSATNDELDWLGIQVTWSNAKFMATVLGAEYACQEVMTDPTNVPETDKNIIIGGGWKPGNSTDFVSAKVAAEQGVDTVVVMTNVPYVYDKDPRKFSDAEPQKELTWDSFKEIIGGKWDPGANTPFDPLACQLAEEKGMKVLFVDGTNLDNSAKAINGESFDGTIIE